MMRVATLLLLLLPAVRTQVSEEVLPTPPPSPKHVLQDFYTYLRETSQGNPSSVGRVKLVDLTIDDIKQLCLDMGYAMEGEEVGDDKSQFVMAAEECLILGGVKYWGDDEEGLTVPSSALDEAAEAAGQAGKRAGEEIEARQEAEEVAEAQAPAPAPPADAAAEVSAESLTADEIFGKSQDGYFCQEEVVVDGDSDGDGDGDGDGDDSPPPQEDTAESSEATIYNPAGLSPLEFAKGFASHVKEDLRKCYVMFYPKFLRGPTENLISKLKPKVKALAVKVKDELVTRAKAHLGR